MIDYTNLEEYLTNVANQMRPYQKDAVAKARRYRKVLIELPTGTGKTLIGLAGVFCYKPQKVLILCTRNAFWTWYKQIHKWFPDLMDTLSYVVVEGTAEKRQQLWKSDANFFVCTYTTWRIDEPPLRFDAIIGDELQRMGKYKIGKDKKTGKTRATTYKSIASLVKDHRIFIGMSAKFRKKGPQDLWDYLHLVDPKFWSSKWRFIGQFCEVSDGFFGKEILGPKNQGALKQAIEPYLFYSDDAEKYLPPINRQYLWVEMTDEQKRMYKELERKRYLSISDGRILWGANPLSLFNHHRKLLVSPRLLDPNTDDFGAGLWAIVEKAQEGDNNHFVIWTYYASAIPTIITFLHQQGYNTIFSLQGGAGLEETRDAEVGFREDPTSLFVGSIRFAQSFELETSRLQFFLGPDWDVPENEQPEGRLRRITTTEPINSLFVQYVNTIDERVYEVLDGKARNIRTTFKDADDFDDYWHIGPKNSS